MSSDHELEFSPDGARCTCGFTGTIDQGVGHLMEGGKLALLAAREAGVIS
jgi:hypothetical protein